MAKRLPHQTWREIFVLYRKGVTITRLAKDYGISRESVYYQLRKREAKEKALRAKRALGHTEQSEETDIVYTKSTLRTEKFPDNKEGNKEDA
jgi:hypothetical protein